MTNDYESDIKLFPFPMAGPIFGDWSGIWRVGATLVATPVGEPCISCHGPILDGEAGGLVYRRRHGLMGVQKLLAVVRASPGESKATVIQESAEPDASAPPLVPVHRGCLLLDVLGHDYGLCGCTGYAGIESRRDAAIEMERRFYAVAGIAALGLEGAAGVGRGDA